MFQSIKKIVKERKIPGILPAVLMVVAAAVVLCGKMCTKKAAFKSQEKEAVNENQQPEQAVYEPLEHELFTVRTEAYADIDGDGIEEKINVTDVRAGSYASTQIHAVFSDGRKKWLEYEGYYESYFIAGDLNGDGATDILLVRAVTGSNSGACLLNALYFDDNEWKEYPDTFISNSEIREKQPADFKASFCVGATIVEGENVNFLRMLWEDANDYAEGKDRVMCVDAAYRNTGWFIESVQVVDNFHKDRKASEFIKSF